MKNIKFLDCVIEHGFTFEFILSTWLIHALIIFLCLNAWHHTEIRSCSGSPLLIGIEIFTMVVSDDKVKRMTWILWNIVMTQLHRLMNLQMVESAVRNSQLKDCIWTCGKVAKVTHVLQISQIVYQVSEFTWPILPISSMKCLTHLTYCLTTLSVSRFENSTNMFNYQ